MKKIFLLTVTFIISLPIYLFLDTGWPMEKAIDVLQPVCFSLSTALVMSFPRFRKYIMALSILILSIMITAYLMTYYIFSYSMGSLGFGIFITVAISYLPELTKKGYVEKL